MNKFISLVVSLAFYLTAQVACSQTINETLLSEPTNEGDQLALLSKQGESPKVLLVLLPGGEGILNLYKPILGNVQVSQLKGNFLVRSNHTFLDANTATLLVDCISPCKDGYKHSKLRAEHIDAVVSKAKQHIPSIESVWVLPTSKGVLSGFALGMHSPSSYKGLVHISGALHYPDNRKLDIGKIKIKQYIVHHVEDPCVVSKFNIVKEMAGQHNVPLIEVSEKSPTLGGCDGSLSAHGFVGIETKVVNQIKQIVSTN